MGNALSASAPDALQRKQSCARFFAVIWQQRSAHAKIIPLTYSVGQVQLKTCPQLLWITLCEVCKQFD